MSVLRVLVAAKMVCVICIDPLERRVRYRVEPATRMQSALQEEVFQPIDFQVLARLVQQAHIMLAGPSHAGLQAELRRHGRLLYDTLVPPALRGLLRDMRGPLLLSTSLDEVPWEMLYDGAEFWGTRFALGRRLQTALAFQLSSRPRRHGRMRALVIGVDARGDLPFVASELEEVADGLRQFADVTSVGGRLATSKVVTSHLQESFDLVHFCGHIVDDGKVGAALVLAEGALLPASLVQPNLAGQPLVFLNGCGGARGNGGGAAWERVVGGMADACLRGGAAAVVATVCEVSDSHAAQFARVFYRYVLGDASFGEGLRRARVELAESAPSSTTWLSFVLYGPPQLGLRSDTTRDARRGAGPRRIDLSSSLPAAGWQLGFEAHPAAAAKLE